MLAAGVLLSLLAALFFGSSAAIQKYRMRRMRSFSLGLLFRDSIWLMSLAVGFFGILFYLMALSSESLSIVQPMMAVSMLIPVVSGWLFFGEDVGTKWIHIIIILTGVVLLSL